MSIGIPHETIFPIMPARLDWSSLIGLFILNHGVLEEHFFNFLHSRMATEGFSIVKKESFSYRAKQIRKLVAIDGHHPVKQTEFASFFERLEPVRHPTHMTALLRGIALKVLIPAAWVRGRMVWVHIILFGVCRLSCLARLSIRPTAGWMNRWIESLPSPHPWDAGQKR
jgi:hypothetical protein